MQKMEHLGADGNGKVEKIFAELRVFEKKDHEILRSHQYGRHGEGARHIAEQIFFIADKLFDLAGLQKHALYKIIVQKRFADSALVKLRNVGFGILEGCAKLGCASDLIVGERASESVHAGCENTGNGADHVGIDLVQITDYVGSTCVLAGIKFFIGNAFVPGDPCAAVYKADGGAVGSLLIQYCIDAFF